MWYMCLYHNLFNHSHIDSYLGRFFDIARKIAMNNPLIYILCPFINVLRSMIANLQGPQILHFGRKHILFNRWSQIILQKASAIYSLTKVSFPKPLPTLNSVTLISDKFSLLF